MKPEIKKLSLDVSVEEWYDQLFNKTGKNDFVIISRYSDHIRWFVTNLTQYLCRIGGHEVNPMFGRHIHDLESCCYQLNLTLPVSYEFRADYHALYDTLLNFETEPPRRIIIWNDAQYLFTKDQQVFNKIFKLMILAGYVNRNGISTIKEDGSRYTVDQRNIFIFQNGNQEEINRLLNTEYNIPSIDGPYNARLAFNIFELVSDVEWDYIS